MQYTWQLALVLVPVYFIKHSVSCYIYYLYPLTTHTETHFNPSSYHALQCLQLRE